MTPLGHLAVSYSGGRFTPSTRAAVVGGVAPDLDFALLALDNFNTLHRLLTHNLLFVLAVALLCALLVRRGAGRVFVSALLGGAGHLFIDAVLDTNPSNGVGVAALWPLSGSYVSPFNLAPALAGTCSGWDAPLAAVRCNLPLFLAELPFCALALLLWWRTERSNGVVKK